MLTHTDTWKLTSLVATYLHSNGQTAWVIWQSICQMAKQHGMVIANVASNVITTRAGVHAALSAAEIQILRNIALKHATKKCTETAVVKAGQRGMIMTLESFIPRLAANFGIFPKGPGPIIIVAAILSVAMTAQEAHAATMDVENYQRYILRYSEYLSKRLAQGDMGRGGHIERPLPFEEWQRSKGFLAF